MAADTSAPARYDGVDRMPIAGTWRPGSAGKTARTRRQFPFCAGTPAGPAGGWRSRLSPAG